MRRPAATLAIAGSIGVVWALGAAGTAHGLPRAGVWEPPGDSYRPSAVVERRGKTVRVRDVLPARLPCVDGTDRYPAARVRRDGSFRAVGRTISTTLTGRFYSRDRRLRLTFTNTDRGCSGSLSYRLKRVNRRALPDGRWTAVAGGVTLAFRVRERGREMRFDPGQSVSACADGTGKRVEVAPFPLVLRRDGSIQAPFPDGSWQLGVSGQLAATGALFDVTLLSLGVFDPPPCPTFRSRFTGRFVGP